LDEDIWPQPPTQPALPPDLSKRIGISDDIMEGAVVYEDVIRDLYDAINREYGTNIQPPLN
jgi:hypothetical protein